MFVRFIDIGGIVDHHRLTIIFTKWVLLSMFILLFNFAIFCDLLGLRRICAWLLLFVSICIADRDPNIKRVGDPFLSLTPPYNCACFKPGY